MKPLTPRLIQWYAHCTARNSALAGKRDDFWSGARLAEPWWWSWARAVFFSCALALLAAYGARLAVVHEPRELLDATARNALLDLLLTLCLCVALCIQLLNTLARPLLGGRVRMAARAPLWQTLYFAAVSALGVALGWPLGMTVVQREVPRWLLGADLGANLWSLLVVGAVFGTFLDWVYTSRMRQLQADKQATESRLRLLQGQIEPHFMFNTLANVHSLIEHDAPKALRMLESFTDYLRSSTLQLKIDDSTVADELALIGAYLQLQQIRMEDRLHYVLDVAPELQALPLPPLLIQPLVENAIRHGIEPKVEGGEVRVRLWRQGAKLCIDVRDTGLGLQASGPLARRSTQPGAGVALTNLRQRLQARWGSSATLTLGPANPGTLATMTLPLPAAQP